MNAADPIGAVLAGYGVPGWRGSDRLQWRLMTHGAVTFGVEYGRVLVRRPLCDACVEEDAQFEVDCPGEWEEAPADAADLVWMCGRCRYCQALLMRGGTARAIRAACGVKTGYDLMTARGDAVRLVVDAQAEAGEPEFVPGSVRDRRLLLAVRAVDMLIAAGLLAVPVADVLAAAPVVPLEALAMDDLSAGEAEAFGAALAEMRRTPADELLARLGGDLTIEVFSDGYVTVTLNGRLGCPEFRGPSLSAALAAALGYP